ncbi:PHB depolymerase family esterase [Streptomyces sp. YIM 98790]|uniref:extracellular catalytic domain type 1 short-chain-length polyhydroxyalkanoate depolymerase n=1 Tax=Streptomyces sp. YIM 98790 TaxID=2689077 RepID=UPI0014096FBD|nr:PHB depolymerase family esterase [Streptomyces sp. YIM 98790]
MSNRAARRVRLLLGTVLAGVLPVLAALLAGAPTAQAAQLTEVTGFGANPSNNRMHLYVPDRVQQRAPVLLALHYCTGTGPAFYSGSEFARLADQYGFIVIYPSANRDGNCWDVSSPQALRRDGGSDPVGLKSMIDYVHRNYSTDPDRVFVTGASSGGMMTNVMLGNYPDVFAAGASFMGVPFGCFATTDGSSWNSQCAQGQRDLTPQQWGDMVRAAYPGYSGARPRMQIWHGTNDDTLRYPNFQEQIDQWTDVHGLSQTPSATDSPQSGWTRTRYGGTGTMAPVEAISLQGVGHSLPQSGQALRAIQFFGLDQPGDTSGGTSTGTTNGGTSTGTTNGGTSTGTTNGGTSTGTTNGGTTGGDPGQGCRVGYSTNTWNTGLVANITLTNTGSSTVSGWSLAFTLPGGQSITSGWNAHYSPNSGAVTATNAAWNATIAPGGSVTIGFQATHTGNSGNPASFTLNGTACTVS